MKFLLSILLYCSLAQATTVVGVIDSGLDISDPRFTAHLCPAGHKDFTGMGLDDTLGHGTHVAGSIIREAKDADYCLLIIKFFDERATPDEHSNNLFRSIRYAVEQGATVVNFSGGGKLSDRQEEAAISYATWVKFFVAAGNNGLNMDKKGNEYYPACYNLKNVYAVGNNGIDAKSNYGSMVKLWENGQYILSTCIHDIDCYMSGTSMSTSIVTGKYLYLQHLTKDFR